MIVLGKCKLKLKKSDFFGQKYKIKKATRKHKLQGI